VYSGQWSQAVSRNPVFAVRVRGAKVGDKVSVTWVDNKGDKRTDEAVVSAS
jgi:sulfur-oxidizing protein SoxZ